MRTVSPAQPGPRRHSRQCKRSSLPATGKRSLGRPPSQSPSPLPLEEEDLTFAMPAPCKRSAEILVPGRCSRRGPRTTKSGFFLLHAYYCRASRSPWLWQDPYFGLPRTNTTYHMLYTILHMPHALYHISNTIYSGPKTIYHISILMVLRGPPIRTKEPCRLVAARGIWPWQ